MNFLGHNWDIISLLIGIVVPTVISLIFFYFYSIKKRKITLEEVKLSMKIAHSHMQLANAELIKLHNVFEQLENANR